MAPPPPEVVQWLKRTYPRPTVDPEWLEGCYEWIQAEHRLDPARDMPAIIKHIEVQLLQSDLADSMLAGTGIPENILTAANAFIEGPILVQVAGIMEIGHSAYSLLQVYESREEWRKQAKLRETRGEAVAEEERKPMPKYPRSMLQFHLSDGISILPAIECKKMPEFELGETPLGYKMIIRNVPVRHQTALLKPECIELKGYLIADRDKNRDALLYRALKARLGEPVEEPLPAPAPSPPPGPAQEPRSPLREITPPLAAADAGPSNSPRRAEREHDDDAGQPRRRKRPSRAGRSPSPDPPPREAVLQRSRYFSKPTSGLNNLATVSNGAPSGGVDAEVDMEDDVGRVRVDSGDADAMQNLARAIGLSPARPAPAHVPLKEDDSDDDPLAPSSNGHPGANGKGKGKGKQRAEPVFGEPASDDYGFEFEMDDSFLEQVDRAEQEALLRAAAANLDSRTNGSQSQSQTHVGSAQTHVRTRTQIKAEPQSQYTTTTTSKTLFSTAAAGTAGTQRPVPRPIPRAGSAAAGPGTSSSGSGADVPMDVIDISDDDVEDKENVPVPTRHVRRRVALPVDADVIELSD